MNILRIHSSKLRRIFQVGVVLTFLFMLYWNLNLVKGTVVLSRANTHLEQSNFRLINLKKRIERFHATKELLLHCSNDSSDYHWLDVTLQFDPIEFSQLLNRLSLLNLEIEKKYHKRGLFVLTKFKTIRESQEDESTKGTNATILTNISERPAYNIIGRLLCLCQ